MASCKSMGATEVAIGFPNHHPQGEERDLGSLFVLTQGGRNGLGGAGEVGQMS